MKKIIPATAVIGLFAITGCENPPEPNSYSEQDQTPQEAGHKARAAKPKKHVARWKGHMNEITIGMSERAAKAILGKPDHTDSTQMKDFEGGTTTMDNWTYGNMFTDDATWMLSFTDGQLDAESRI